MTGMLKINRLVGQSDVDYQVNFTAPGKSYARSYTQEHLTEFLVNTLDFTEEAVDDLFDELRENGNALVDDVEIAEHDMGVMGYELVPSEY